MPLDEKVQVVERDPKEATNDMFGSFNISKAAIAIVSGILGLGLLGGAAFAAFAPAPADTFSLVPGLEGTPTLAAAPKPANHRLKAILDSLVAKRVITQAQEDAILAAVAANEGNRDKGREDLLRRAFAGLFEQSAAYLEMKPTDLKTKLPGTSLAAIANATAGKSSDGLVAHLTKAADAAIAKALADGKITKDQADKATAAVPDHIAKFVDHTYPKREVRPVTPKVQAFIGDAASAARDYLGLQPADVMKQLRAGKSLGEIANGTTGRSREGLIAAITGQANAKIDKAQQDGKLTAEAATQLKASLQGTVTGLVDRKATAVKPASK